jgi:DNA-binding SARP family transcriptional activator
MVRRGARQADRTNSASGSGDGWQTYRLALRHLERAEWPRALTLLAAAETTFRAHGDQPGLWRALVGQALLHWHAGAVVLATARALAALRAADAAGEHFAVGCIAWQLANMALAQGEYRAAAGYLAQAQAALDAAGTAPPGGALAAAAQLCTEIARWQQACEPIDRCAAMAALDEARCELAGRLSQAAAWLRATHGRADTADGPMPLLLPAAPVPADMAAGSAASEPTPSKYARLWASLRRIIGLRGAKRRIDGPVDADAALRSPDVPLPSSLAEGGAMPVPAAPTMKAAVDAPPQVEAPPDERGATSAAPSAPAAPEAQPDAAGMEASAQPDLPDTPAPVLAAHLLGPFRVTLNGRPIESWPSGRGRAVLKYLLAQRGQPVPRDVLMDRFWPDASPEAARRNLHQAIYSLRQALRAAADVPVVVFQDGAYCLSTELRVWVDIQEFERHIAAGRRHEATGQLAAAAAAYEAAVNLYSGDFLADDPYEEWPLLTRERLRVAYLATLDRLAEIVLSQGQLAACVLLCQRILACDHCHEDAHRRLMRCYSRQGQHHLALRQYQACVEALRDELDVEPDPATTQLYERIRRREQV